MPVAMVRDGAGHSPAPPHHEAEPERITTMLRSLSIPAACALVLAWAEPASAQRTITVNSFKGSNLWPVWAAQPLRRLCVTPV